ncbi:MAG: hypothetical protein AAF654_02990 [Myxococcota bacterium]
MTSIRRGNSLNRYKSSQASLGRGGSGRSHRAPRAAPADNEFRYSADPAAELMPAAEFLGTEPDFPAILETFEGSPFDPARRKVLGRLMGVFAMDYQGARSEERRFLRRLLSARNAKEGYSANRGLHLCGTHHAIRRTLALGVAESRQAHGPMRGFLGAVQARTASTTLRLLGPESRELIWATLTLAGTRGDGGPIADSDAVIERALILKALAARRARLGPWAEEGPEALEEVVQFAREIRGSHFEHLARTTCIEDGAPLEAARGEVDPIYAWAHHGRQGDVRDGRATEVDPWEILGEPDRNPLVERPRYHQALAEARARPEHPLNEASHAALSAFITGEAVKDEKALDAAFELIDTHAFDLADREVVTAIREDARGIYRFDAARALSDLLSRVTGATYLRKVFSDQLTAGTDPIDQIAGSIDAGMAVPVTFQELRHRRFRALSVLTSQPVDGKRRDYKLRVSEPGGSLDAYVLGSMLTQPELPSAFGKRSRVDAYFSPAALDLLAPPFGIPFEQLGIEDKL